MYSNKSEYSHRRHYSNRDSRPWDEEGKREERLEPQRNVIRDPYGKNSVDGHSSREYSDLHKRQNSPDSKRDWRRKSPVRRRMSSPDRSLSVKRRRTSPEQDHYRHQREPEETYGQPPEDYSQVRAKDIKRTLSLEEDYSRKRTPEDTRYSHIHDELPYIQHQDEPSYRQTDRDGRERSRDQPQESTRSRDLTDYSPPRMSGIFSRDYGHHSQNKTWFSQNGSSQQTSDSNDGRQSPPPAAAGKKQISKGFQRFLNVLNMGVNVDTLTKLVNQGTPNLNDRPQSPSSAPDQPWSVGSARRQHSGLQNTRHWSETERTDTLASPQRCPRSYSSNGKEDEWAVEIRDSGRKILRSDIRSISPSALVNATRSPEEEYKHRQMQDVLQAIGMNLEYEELGQMSNRIQERLYGKKQNDKSLDHRDEIAPRRAYSPRGRSGSSSRSSSSPSVQDYNKRIHSAVPVFSPTTPNYTTPDPVPVIPPNPVMNYPPPPPNMPPVMPRMFMPPVPPVPPFLSYGSPMPPVNMFPPVVHQSGSVLPPHMRFPQLPFFNLPPPLMNINAQKTKTTNRPRCLQVIKTKPG